MSKLRPWRLPAAPPAGVAIALFVYLVYVRTSGVSQTFWLLGDQIRDWSIALGRWQDLPLTGTPSSVGGASLGPVFYWVLWAIRRVIGPWTGNNLPHAGAIGLSILQSAADAFLLVAIVRKTGSLLLATALTLLVATGPLDLALTATIWNPSLSVALVKTATALVLLAEPPVSFAQTAAVVIVAWLAVQAHSSAVFVAAPAVAALVLRDLSSARWTMALGRARLIVELLLLLQVPFLLHVLRHPAAPAGPRTVIDNVSYTLAHPSELRIESAAEGVGAMLHGLLVAPWTWPSFAPFLLVCGVAAAVYARRDLALASVTLFPLAAAVAGFALWRRPLDAYWFLTLAPAAVLTIGFATRAWPPLAPAGAVIVFVVALLVQPGRIAYAHQIHRLPEYAVLVRGSQEIRAYTPEVQRIETEFTLPPTTDPTYVYKILGGRVTDASGLVATIGASGHVRFTQGSR